ncbi:rhodopsin, GQ-coupled isoform X3 [Anabrus simplex]|uniref:rhodopsin, GQ-coupled isoform X3 n=1 Tax=Anabrus simplex TaxID=316456 RepID=UPI0035A26BBA
MASNLRMILLVSILACLVPIYTQRTDKITSIKSESVILEQLTTEKSDEYPSTLSAEEAEEPNNHNITPSIIASTTIDCPSLEELDFLNYDAENASEVQALERRWPCELRSYWLSIHGFVKFVQFLFNYFIIVLVIFGLLVNVASLCVLNSPPMNTSSITVYLQALAISDIGALLFNVTMGILRAHIQEVNDLYLHNSVMCFLQRFLSIVFFYFSNWIVVALTFERLVMIRSPFKGQLICNFRPSHCVIVILGCVCLVIGLIRTQISGFEKENMYGYSSCDSSKWDYFVIPLLSLTTIFPTFLIFIGNICMLLQIRRSAQDHCNLQASKSDERMNTLKITRMLLVISVTYFVLLLPAGVTGCLELYWRTTSEKQHSNTEESHVKCVRDPHQDYWIQELEKIQRNAARFVRMENQELSNPREIPECRELHIQDGRGSYPGRAQQPSQSPEIPAC